MIPQEQNLIIPHKDYRPPAKGGKSGEGASPAFGNAAALVNSAVNGTFTALERSEILGPFIVDALSMDGPRIGVDFTRGKAAGWETARRELISTDNAFFMPAVYALATGALLTKFKGPNLFIAGDMVDEMKEAWTGSGQEEFIYNMLKKTGGLAGNKYKGFDDDSVKKYSDELVRLMDDPKTKRSTVKKLAERAVEALGAEKNIIVSKDFGKMPVEQIEKKAETNLKRVFCNIFDMGRAINKTVAKTKEKNASALPKEILGDVAKMMDKVKSDGKIKSTVGIGITVAAGFALQYINRYLTSRETGTNAFVGLPDYENRTKHNAPDKPEKKKKSGSLIPGKIAASLAMLYMTTASVINRWKPHKMPQELKKLGKIIEMKSRLPSLNHFKMIVGLTLIGRILAAEDKYELRETSLRDILFTYPQFLILGDLLNQGVAYKLAKKDGKLDKVFNGNLRAVEDAKNIFKKAGAILKLSRKTEAEIGTLRLDKQIEKEVKNIGRKSTMAGYAYSIAILGLGIPFLNKWMTNSAYRREHKGRSGMDKFMKNVPVVQGFGV